MLPRTDSLYLRKRRIYKEGSSGRSRAGKRTFRVENDPLGEKEIPADVMHGVQTARALENFPISSLRIHPGFYRPDAEIKKAIEENQTIREIAEEDKLPTEKLI